MWSNMQSLINLSIVLNTIDVKLIGRSFSTKFVGPFFWIGVTFASFHSNARSKNRRKIINDQIQPKNCTKTSGKAKSY
jgi:hypothetical protein